jgi:site-specific DNA-cytosine methylase
MSPRELARIQGVPDSFKIHLDKDNLQYWINKGRASVTKCPPYQIAQWFKERIESCGIKEWKS